MARTFTEADFAPQQQASAPAASQGRRFSDADFAQADTLPSYADGLSPETAINSSPVGVDDRAKLAVGNDAGRMKYLKERFGDVQRTKSGDFVVKDNGFWKRVDPSGLGDGNAWDKTKELVADAADLVPTAASLGAQLGAATGLAAVTGGTSLAAQAGVSAAVGAAIKAGETSLGRLVGTYEASAEDQLLDIGIESVMNLGGTYLAAGVKPTMGYIANGVKQAGQAISKSGAPAKQALMEGWANMTGVGAKSLQTLVDNPEAVSAAMKRAAAGGSDDVVGALVRENINDIKTISKTARAATSSYYDSLSKDVIDNVPNNFSSDISKSVKSAYQTLADNGIGAIDDAGKFTMFSKKELASQLAESGQVNQLLTDDKSFKIINEMVDELSPYLNAKNLHGKMGANQLMQFRKVMGDFTYRLKEEADDAFLAPAQRLLAQVNDAIDNSVLRSFDLQKPVRSAVTGQETTNLLATANQAYKDTLNTLNPLLNASRQAIKAGNDVPYETLYNQLGTLQGRNTVRKTAFDSAFDILNNHGGAAGKAAAQKMQDINIRQAAASFTPTFKRGLVSQGSAAVGTGALMSGNPATAGLALGAAAATSPRLQKTLITSAMKAKGLMSSLSPMDRMQFINNPNAISEMVKTVMQAPEAQTQITNQLMQQGVNAVRGGGSQQGGGF